MKTETMTESFVRRYRPSDRTALADICVRTAHKGGDSSGLYADSELMPSIFAYPYVELELEFAFVLDDGAGRAVGYVLGAADTNRFALRFRTEWLPKVAARYPEPAREPATPTEEMARLLHTPERMVRDTNSPRIPHICTSTCCRRGRGAGTGAP